MLHHIFEPFSQGHTSLDRSQGGLGLGLALVKGMVELHSGAIDARSEGAGCGSEFIVRLPLATAQAVSGSSAPDQTKISCRYRILIIEDNRLAARSSQMILEQSGHTVEVTHSGPHGIEVARRFNISCGCAIKLWLSLPTLPILPFCIGRSTSYTRPGEVPTLHCELVQWTARSLLCVLLLLPQKRYRRSGSFLKC